MLGGMLMDVQMKRGLLEVCVLAAIKDEESYGYKIVKDMKPYVDISESTLYPILRRLEESGMLTVRSAEHNGRLRKYYRITLAGRARIETFKKEWSEMVLIYKFVTEERK
jgi:PadR family transcriptional regulator PadR